jgi:hypothetical protein
MNTHKSRIQKIATIGFLVCVPSIIAVHSVAATAVRPVFSDQAQGTTGEVVRVDVAPGVGLNISFISTGEIVKKAWIDDPSRITLSFDGNLCQAIAQGQECSSESGATVVHLRQIRPIDFPDLLSSRSGGTLLTLITEGAEGRKLYQFRVRPVLKEPGYTTLAVRPTTDKTQAEVIPQPSPPTSLAQVPLFSQPLQPPTSTVELKRSLPPNLVAEQPAPETVNRLSTQPSKQSPTTQTLMEQPQNDSIAAPIPNKTESQPRRIATSPPLEKLIHPVSQIAQAETPLQEKSISESSTKAEIAGVSPKAAEPSDDSPISTPTNVGEWSQQLSSSDYFRQLQR